MMRRGHEEGEGHRGQGRRPDETRGGKASEGEEKGGTDRVDSCVYRGKRGGTEGDRCPPQSSLGSPAREGLRGDEATEEGGGLRAFPPGERLSRRRYPSAPARRSRACQARGPCGGRGAPPHGSSGPRVELT